MRWAREASDAMAGAAGMYSPAARELRAKDPGAVWMDPVFGDAQLLIRNEVSARVAGTSNGQRKVFMREKLIL